MKLSHIGVGATLLALGLVAGYLAGARGPITGSLLADRADQERVGPAKREAQLPAPVGTNSSPAPDNLTAAQARNLEVDRMVASGPDSRDLKASALRVGESWSRAARKESVELEFADWRCYRAGCVTHVRHAPDMLDRLTRAISTDQGFVGWSGEKFRSGPIEQPDGKIEVTWILYAPPEGEPVLVDGASRGDHEPSVKR